MSKQCMSLWREVHVVNMYQALQLQSTFRKLRRPKVYVAMARSTCSQNGQSTGASKHFWEVEMSKKCLRLWREACFEVQKKLGVRSTVGRTDVISCGRRSGFCIL